jgi:hypothetical protein
MGISMKKGVLIAVIAIQLLIALTSVGTIRSLAELAAFLLVVLFSLDSRRDPLSNRANRSTS